MLTAPILSQCLAGRKCPDPVEQQGLPGTGEGHWRPDVQTCFQGDPLSHSMLRAGPFEAGPQLLSVCPKPSPSVSNFPVSLLKTACCQARRPRPATSAYHVLNDFILPVLPLHLQQMVAEVKQVKAPLLAQQDDDGAACPIQAVAEALPGGGKGKRRERLPPKPGHSCRAGLPSL